MHCHTSSSTYVETYTQKFSHLFLHATHTNRFQHRMDNFLEEKIKCKASFYLLLAMMRKEVSNSSVLTPSALTSSSRSTGKKLFVISLLMGFKKE